jgi:hypothetical protein
MSNLKKKLTIIFDRIILKFYTNIKNNTFKPTALELLREEIQVFICIFVTLELKFILTKIISYLAEENSNTNVNSLADKITRIVLFSSKQKIISKLNLSELNLNIELSEKNYRLWQKISIESYSFLILIWKDLRYRKNNSIVREEHSLLWPVLVENFIIKISDHVVYEAFLNGTLSKKFFLELYVIDFFIFSYNLVSLQSYLYWKFYLENFYVNIRRFSTHRYEIILWTKDGFKVKKFHKQELTKEISLPKIFKIITKYVYCMEYLYYKNKIFK